MKENHLNKARNNGAGWWFAFMWESENKKGYRIYKKWYK